MTITLLLVATVCAAAHAKGVRAWSNGGYSEDPAYPDYGTHDWIGHHALDWLPTAEKQYLLDNLAAYCYGTELPDNGIAPDGIGDTTKHHVYYWANGSVQDAAAAVRAAEEYNKTLDFLRGGDVVNASKTAGILSHYLVDVAVFGHVMAANTDWGAETHHSDYESYVNERTNSYDDAFNGYLSFDGELNLISAYDATTALAFDTTFDAGNLSCAWMDLNYNWSNPTFQDRCGASLNLAVNYLTDVLHTLYTHASCDIAITDVTLTLEVSDYRIQPDAQIYPSCGPIDINVTVYNNGTLTTNVTVTSRYHNGSGWVTIGTRTLTSLAPSTNRSVTLTWHLIDVPLCERALTTTAITTCGATDTFSWGSFVLKLPGDVDGDGDVDPVDVFSYIAPAFGKSCGQPGYNQQCDFDGDCDIDPVDIFSYLAPNYGQTYCA